MKPFFAFLPLALLAACSPKLQIPPTVTVADEVFPVEGRRNASKPVM